MVNEIQTPFCPCDVTFMSLVLGDVAITCILLAFCAISRSCGSADSWNHLKKKQGRITVLYLLFIIDSGNVFTYIIQVCFTATEHQLIATKHELSAYFRGYTWHHLESGLPVQYKGRLARSWNSHDKAKTVVEDRLIYIIAIFSVLQYWQYVQLLFQNTSTFKSCKVLSRLRLP